MSDPTETDESTRRNYMKYSGAVIAGGLLAGCAGGEATDTTSTPADTTAAETTAETGDTTTTDTDTATTTEDDSYSVSMVPVGEVEFDGVPETWLSFTGDWADMGVALGQGDGLAAVGVKARYASHLYESLPGVSVDTDAIEQLYDKGVDKERFYAIDADVHVIDPNFAVNRLRLQADDVDEIGNRVAPFFGNTIFSRAYDWHDYRYYSLYEAFGKLATMFDERERYEAFRSYHDEILADVASRLPPAAERPNVAILYPADVPPESFYPYLVGEGSQSKHWRDLGVGDALGQAGVADAQASGATVDFERLLEIDPDVLAVRLQGETTEQYFQENIVAPLEDHDVASELSAVENDRVIYGGVTYQGPIIHLFQLERAAGALYPDVFGDEQLFDRERVAEIVTGEF